MNKKNTYLIIVLLFSHFFRLFAPFTDQEIQQALTNLQQQKQTIEQLQSSLTTLQTTVSGNYYGGGGLQGSVGAIEKEHASLSLRQSQCEQTVGRISFYQSQLQDVLRQAQAAQAATEAARDLGNQYQLIANQQKQVTERIRAETDGLKTQAAQHERAAQEARDNANQHKHATQEMLIAAQEKLNEAKATLDQKLRELEDLQKRGSKEFIENFHKEADKHSILKKLYENPVMRALGGSAAKMMQDIMDRTPEPGESFFACNAKKMVLLTGPIAMMVTAPVAAGMAVKKTFDASMMAGGALWRHWIAPKPNFFIPSTPEQQLLTLKNFEGSPEMIAYLTNIINSVSYAMEKNINMVLNHALFVGPAGVGKTEAAMIIANMLGLKFYLWDVSKYSEGAGGVQDLEKGFAFIKKCARKGEPVLLLMDEIDGMLSNRQTSNEKSAVLSKLLNLLGSNSKKGFEVFIIATTNKLDAVDPAILSRFIVKQFEELSPESVSKFAIKELKRYANESMLNIGEKAAKATQRLIMNVSKHSTNAKDTSVKIDISDVAITGRDSAALAKFLTLGLCGEDPESYEDTDSEKYSTLFERRNWLTKLFMESLAIKQMATGKDFGKVAGKKSHHPIPVISSSRV